MKKEATLILVALLAMLALTSCSSDKHSSPVTIIGADTESSAEDGISAPAGKSSVTKKASSVAGKTSATTPSSSAGSTAKSSSSTTVVKKKALSIAIVDDGQTYIRLAKLGSGLPISEHPGISCPADVDICFGRQYKSGDKQLILQNATDTVLKNLTITGSISGTKAWVISPSSIPRLDLPGKSSLIPIITIGIPHGTPLYKIGAEPLQWDGTGDSKGVVIDTVTFKWDGGEETYTFGIVAMTARIGVTKKDLMTVNYMDDTGAIEAIVPFSLRTAHVEGNCQVWDTWWSFIQEGRAPKYTPYLPGSTIEYMTEEAFANQSNGTRDPYDESLYAATNIYYSECIWSEQQPVTFDWDNPDEALRAQVVPLGASFKSQLDLIPD